MVGGKKKPAQRDEKGRFVKAKDEKEIVKAAMKAGAMVVAGEERKRSPVNGQPVPQGKPFRTSDERAREAGRKSGIARKEKGDLRRLCQLWMEEDVATDKDGNKITGGQMMVRVAVKEVSKGNPRFWELLRDTAGYKPVDKVMVSEVEPAVIAEVEEMVKEAGE
jgi:hypothetical protein